MKRIFENIKGFLLRREVLMVWGIIVMILLSFVFGLSVSRCSRNYTDFIDSSFTKYTNEDGLVKLRLKTTEKTKNFWSIYSNYMEGE